MGTVSFRASLRIGVAGMVVGGCGGIQTPEPGPTSYLSPMCVPEFAGHSLSPSPGRTAGVSVTVADTGANLFSSTGPFLFPDRIDVVSGSPGTSRLGSYGEVGFQPVSIIDGEPDGGPLPLLDNVTIPGLDPGGQFGEVVVSADIVTHFDDRSGRSSHGLIAAGQEVLVAEPNTDLGGRVHWLYSTYDADPDVDPLSSPDLYRWEHGGVFDPALGAGARFGAAIATPSDPGWGNQVPYAVVSAPNIDAVFVTPLTPAWTPGSGGAPATASPFTTSTRIDGSAVGLPSRGFASLFGHALLIDDLDGNGFDDLIVGAPGDYCPAGACTPGVSASPLAGEVYVIPGTSTGFDTSQAFRIDPPSAAWFSPGSGFGASLAAGFLHDVESVGAIPTLVIGAPRAQDPSFTLGGAADPGQVCQIQFDAGFPAPGAPPPTPQACDWAPWNNVVDAGPTGTDNMHLFGEQVAVANLIEQDSVGSNTTVHSAMHELVVSSPRSQQAIPGFYTSGGKLFILDYGGTPLHGTAAPIGPVGLVAVFRSVQGQGATLRLDSEDPDTLALRTLRSAQTPVAGEHLGSAMVVDQLSVLGGLPDLILGEPTGLGTGQVSFTKSSRSVNGFTSGIGGEWSAQDSSGVIRPVSLLPSGPDYGWLFGSFGFELREDGGDPTSPLCTATGFPGSTTLTAFFDDVSVLEDPNATDVAGQATPTQHIELKNAGGNTVLRFSADILHQNLGGAHTMSLTLFDAEEPTSGGGWQQVWPGADCRPITAAGGGTFVLTQEVKNACE